jgi:hypothetical protein
VLLIYTHNTRMKTGWITTEDLIPPNGGRYMPARADHPQAQNAQLMMLAMMRYFREETTQRSRPTLREAYDGALKFLANPEDYKFLPATSAAAERILVKG